jgi:DNA-binding transcriptional ArsR family regulator
MGSGDLEWAHITLFAEGGRMPEKKKEELFSDEEHLDNAIQCLKVLAHPLRLKILVLLMEGPTNVSALEKVLGSSQPNISQHLAIMRYRGMLKQDKKGNEVYYSIKNQRLHQMLLSISGLFCGQETD